MAPEGGVRRKWQGQKPLIFMRFHEVSLGNQHKIWSKQHNGKVRYDVSPAVWLPHQLRAVPCAGLGQEPALPPTRRTAQALLDQTAQTLGLGRADPAVASRRQQK